MWEEGGSERTIGCREKGRRIERVIDRKVEEGEGSYSGQDW